MKLNEGDGITNTMTALAHPARRQILQRVMRAEMRVTDLAQPFEMSLNAISKHIKVLEEAGLVHRRRAWREHFVSFDPKPLQDVVDWIEQTRAFWNPRLDKLEALLKAEDEPTPFPKEKSDDRNAESQDKH